MKSVYQITDLSLYGMCALMSIKCTVDRRHSVLSCGLHPEHCYCSESYTHFDHTPRADSTFFPFNDFRFYL